MSGLVNKIKTFVGLAPEFDDEEDVYEDLYAAEAEYPVEENMALDPVVNTRKKSNLKVLSHPSAAGSYEVMVIEPRSFEESLEIVNNLREKKSIILNLHLLDAEQSQRIVDFLSGATHAIDGHQQRIGEGVFIFTPNNVAISAETEKARVIRDAFWNQPQ
ncbi:MAG: cell division protein SepF [Bacteroidota bacterium]|nr:cell division protein SepF [Bacteroidota bacterium]